MRQDVGKAGQGGTSRRWSGTSKVGRYQETGVFIFRGWMPEARL
jgi:hypothetical protein